MTIEPGRLQSLRTCTAEMVDQLGRLVSIETPSDNLAACHAGAEEVSAMGAEVLGAPAKPVEIDGRIHLRWHWPSTSGQPRVLLIGHYDTVWPLGTLGRWPFSVDWSTGKATGPGCFDMKAGIVQLFHAVASLQTRDGVEILLTSDEEIGSTTSRGLIQDAARHADAALVFEGSTGPLKTGRKGTGMYRIDIHGRAAHAGLEPENGRNALTVLGDLLLQMGDVARPELGTTVTPTLAGGGTASNVVPAHAWLELDVRVAIDDEAKRVDDHLRSLESALSGVNLALSGGPRRPPMPVERAEGLFTRAAELALALELAPLTSAVVGGGSDGNFTAAEGCATLDGLGAVGDGAHAEGEYIVVSAMSERSALVAELIEDIRRNP